MAIGDRQHMKPRPGELAFLHGMMREQAAQYRKLHLGYTIEEERMWLIFNRCCHRGRKIQLRSRPVYMAMGKPTVRVPIIKDRAINMEIIKAASA